MNLTIKTFSIALLTVTLNSCQEIQSSGEERKEEQVINTVSGTDSNLPFKNQGTSYVPIYSDIYSETKEFRFQLTATLSIRNTSPKDTLFITKVSYHNTGGETVREYVERPIFLKPLETLEYVIEQDDTEGGTGANFMIDWAANDTLKPLFQAVMIGFVGQQGFAFTAEGVEIGRIEEE